MKFLCVVTILSLAFGSVVAEGKVARSIDSEEILTGPLPTTSPEWEGSNQIANQLAKQLTNQMANQIATQLVNQWAPAQPSKVDEVADNHLLDEAKYVPHPHTLTRLIKTLSYGFHPQILTENYVQPEKRRKPVTLVGLRKNGRFPRQNFNIVDPNNALSREVAELQSPFNDIGLYWLDPRN